MSGPKGEEIRYHDTISEIRFPYVAGDRAANSKILDQTAAKRSSHSLWSIQANPCLAYYFLSLTIRVDTPHNFFKHGRVTRGHLHINHRQRACTYLALARVHSSISSILSRSNNHDDVRAIEPEGSEEPSHAQ
ncbi:hypothetical protein SEVIR_4G047200v4 [Setaria viridis]|uniref:Uncharacterized protein n=1 Tax=Setaria viridis TaxID=4556 RepID=A0A4U6UX08_SETVI|nr:hypothetical protein SEVIR_4G047200v2 [Setaria viridis]